MLYVTLGVLVAVLTGLANTPVSRLAVAGAAGLLIAFVAFPLSTAAGFLSRQTISPTPAALLPVYPAFALVALLAIFSLVAWRLGPQPAGGVALLTGAVTLGLALLWPAQGTILVRFVPLNGLMETLTGLALAFLIALLGWGRRGRWAFVALGLAVGLGVSLWLASSPGRTYFPNVAGYYRVAWPVPASTEGEVIATYNAGLEDLNRQRAGIGLAPLEPIDAETGLAGARLPREAADAGLRLVQAGAALYGSRVMLLMAGLLLGAGGMTLWRPRPATKTEVRGGALLAGIVSILAPAFAATDFDLGRLVAGWPFLQNFLDRSWPPDPGALQQVASEMLITLEIALIGTFLAALFAVPLSFLAARNLTQGNAFMRGVFILTRGFFNIDRGVDTLILALVFVAAVGLGPFAGILAMAIHSIADLGKVYSESIENVDRGPIEALEAVGASGTNVVRWAILPQVGPLFIAWTLYRFEINFRVSIVLGLVGAGGIGFFIQEKMATGTYDQMVVAILAIILVVNLIDFGSSWLRGRLT